MKNKTKTTAPVLCFIALGFISCKKTLPQPDSKDPERTAANQPCDASGRTNHTMIAMQGWKLSPEEAQRLEEELQANPEDLAARIRLLGWYTKNQFASSAAREARPKHIFWIIQNRPEAQIAETPEVWLDPILDKDAYEQAKTLWLQQTKAQETNAIVLGNAADYFLIHDREIAKDLLEKAQTLEPENPEWSEKLGHLHSLGLLSTSGQTKTELACEALRQLEKSYAAAPSDQDKFYKLADLAKMAYEAGNSQKAETYANDLLAQADHYKNNWNYGNAIHHANLILGRIALKSGEVEKAKQHLIQAGKTPGSPQLNSFGPNMALAKELLEQNERDTVLQYFELCGNFWEMGQEKLKNWTALVKEGGMPDFQANLTY